MDCNSTLICTQSVSTDGVGNGPMARSSSLVVSLALHGPYCTGLVSRDILCKADLVEYSALLL